MGNANTSTGGSGHRERTKSGDSFHNQPPSPADVGLKDGQAFTFEKKTTPAPTPTKGHPKIILQTSHDLDDEPLYTGRKSSDATEPRRRLDTDPPPYTTDEIHDDMDDDLSLGRTRSSTISGGSSTLSNTKGPQSKILPTVFKWDAGGKQVFISGTFSDWKTIPMVKRFGLYSHGDFVTILDLPEGEHQYKFLIDGEWKHDPNEPSRENDQGTRNNVITVKKTDFEVFDALDVDSNASSNNPSDNSGGGASKEFGQEIPTYKPWEKTAGPPILPPHLLQVILNKDTPLSCEPTLLPEPNHVMLNHLYALSIKDGVMVLSATHRYRKKYVTTLLYKPI